jgi:hypothetical protein
MRPISRSVWSREKLTRLGAYQGRVWYAHDQQDVTLKIDLARLCRVGEEAGTLDLHVNFAPTYLHVVRERAPDSSSR